MSRIIVKNLPKKTTSDQLKALFSTKGELTDVAMKYTKDGVFRNFAFIGFKTEDQAQSAKEFYHETFVGTSRIKIEICKDLGSTEVKPWSKHSKNKQKSAGDKKAAEINEDKEKSLVEQLDDDPQFAEFCEVHKKRRDKPIWANDGLNMDANQIDDESGPEEEVEPVVKEIVAKQPKVVAKPKKDVQYTLRVKGLPVKCEPKDIKAFFGKKYTSLRRPKNAKDVAFVQFKNDHDLRAALIKHRGFLNGCRIFLKDITIDNRVENESKFNEEQEENAKQVEALTETGRIYARNLTYTCTEADLEEVFKPYGPLTEVLLPIDKFTKKIKGFGFITFVFPEHALKAFEELDGTMFQGRTFHLMPANPPKKDTLDDDASFADKKQSKLKEQSGSSHTWNSLFLGANAVADVMASKYNTTKAKLLDSEKNQSLAVRMALGETQIVAETKEFLTENGVDLKAFDSPTEKTERSKTCFLVKNLPAKTSPSELMPVFSKFGDVKQILLPPSGITAIVEFQNQTEAKTAFTNSAYKRFGSTPLYLEWAPLNIFSADRKEPETDKPEPTEVENIEIETTIEENREEEEVEEEVEEIGSTLFVKNLNFFTTENELKEHFKCVGKIINATVAKKKDPKNPGGMLSMGYGFVQFKKQKYAQKALKEMQHSKLEGHALELKISNRVLTSEQTSSRKKVDNKEQKTTKLLIRNIPFEADVKEIRELFTVFGELKFVRMPQKMSGTGSHRGFGFVDFVTRQDAKRAMESLSASTHLYGRRLVLEWANSDDNDVETLRRKTADNYQPGLSKSKKLKQNIQNDL